ncbi:hypothetical protein [Flavobacterium adhaerens]|uniref:hypothetical protein n=1 Tax=Flavobacterium adhaerens TaxID=3149043 RepID=UPI0032B488F3
MTCTYGQVEFSNKFKGIPPVNTKPKTEKKEIPPVDPNTPVIIPPNIYKNPNVIQPQPNPVDDYKLPVKSEISMTPKDEFINPGDEVRDRLNKKTDRQESLAFRRNQNLGTFNSSANSATVMYRDAQYVDGDLIRVYLNGVVIQTQVYLTSSFKGFDVELKKGFNKIDFEALNQGDSGPNTAEFRVFDDQKNLISASEWNLATGFKATIIIVKD